MKDPIRLAEAISAVLNDEKSQQTFGKNAQARAKEKFGLEKMIIETEKVYREITLEKHRQI
jgi:glycosyltransferase involved in cell wall biosynthesis